MKKTVLFIVCLAFAFSAKAQIYNVVGPQSTTICANDELTLSVSADGTDLMYAWFHNFVEIPNANAPVFSVSGASSTDNGFYYCKISSGSDNVFTTSAQVTVNSVPVITTQPVQAAQACEGSFFQPFIYAEGNNLTYQWFHDNVAISGATTNGLNVFPVTLNDAGEYHCEVSSGNCFSVISGSTMMAVTPSLGEFSDITQCGSYTLPALMTPGAQYWTGPQGSGTILPAGTAITSTQQVYVYLPNAGSCDNEENFVIYITDAFTTQMYPEETTIVTCPSNPIELFMETTSSGTLTFEWSKDGVAIEGANQNTFTATMPGVYTCKVSNGCGIFIEHVREIIDAESLINPVPQMTVCVNPTGTTVIDLTGLATQIAGQTQSIVKFYATEDDAIADTNDFMSQNGNLLYTLTQQVTVYTRVNIPDFNNPQDCQVTFPVQLIPEECPVNNNSISGTIRIDADNNGCTADDEPAAGIAVQRTFGNTIYYTYTNAQGQYTFNNVEEGSGYVSLYGPSLPQSGYVTSPTQDNGGYIFNFEEDNNTLSADFCLAVPAPVTDAQIYFFAYNNAVPGFAANYGVNIYNPGTLPVSGEAVFTFDDTKLDFVAAFPAGASIAGNTIHYNVAGLQPLQAKQVYLYFTVKTPPTVNSGDLLHFTATITTVNTDVNPSDNSVALNQVVVNSFDPNDIAVQQGPEIVQDQVDDDLIYTIRCQNTGTGNAVNIRIATTLDEKLDWNTFRPITASDDFTTDRIGNEVVFRFKGINLPPSSVNEPESNGFIMYRVKPKATLQVGDVIAATADIFFDFNAPITTNTAMTELVEPLGVTSFETGFTVHPNPASGAVKLYLENTQSGETVASLIDMQGKKIMESGFSGNEGRLDISKVQPGVYIVKVVSGDKTAVRKLIVK
ncbi:DUF7619 domain-containing protein [Flavobacterium pallidum]|uniref:Ig-like domain-containing protein n=1 Tax=Flavobacterium pallidum TaxID=2172098 RepID=A0A2S1SES8_9FLAO|nr:T9SS type A sorting domain-containing protein [Flavobacterium pallidum]AWI24874.1 hypothetical protein HYN49_02630 [Flavobacterium pallidum]